MIKDVKKISFELPEQDEREEPVHKTLRHATLDDVPAILSMAEKLYKDSPMEKMSLDYDKTRREIEKVIVNNGAEYLALVSYEEDKAVGAIIAYTLTPVFSSDKIAIEIFWYLDPEYRKGTRGIAMMKAYEYWAKLVGCRIVQYGWLVSSPESLKTIYDKTGAVLSEQVYYKEL